MTPRLAALVLLPLALAGSLACAVAVGSPDAVPAAPAKTGSSSDAAPAGAAPGGAAPGASAGAPGAGAPGGSAPGAAAPDGWQPCGELACRRFATPAAALGAVLDADKPMVLGLGEAHAQKGTETIASTAWRTTHQLVPVLAGRASDLVLELWVADGSCGKKREEKVAAQQKPVTENQAASNKSEYVVLAEKAKALALQPHVLRPSCDEVERVAKAGDDAIVEMLSIITRAMESKVVALRAQPGRAETMVVTYGGALHNDLAPLAGREGWSFGPALAKATADRYVELDLVVPEYVKDTPSWTQQRWYAAWLAMKDAPAEGATLVRVAPRSYAMFLPRGVTRETR